jgi:hypothetical protein
MKDDDNNNINNGDTIYFNTGGDYPSWKIGKLLCKTNDGKYNTIFFATYGGVQTFQVSQIHSLDKKDMIIKDINFYFDFKINELKSKLQSVKREDYKYKITQKYELLKQEIINTARNIVSAQDKDCLVDVDFENAIKAISAKKKILFELDCDEISIARKANGEIKYKIKELETNRKQALSQIEDEVIIDKYIK